MPKPSVANEEQDETNEEADGMADAVEATEAAEPNPDGFLHTCIRLPRGHDVALAHAEIVLLDRTLSLFDAHYDEVLLASEQRANRDPQRHDVIASPTTGLDGSQADPLNHVATASPTACLDGLQVQQILEAEETSTRPRRRRGAFHLDPKVLEAKVSKRYEVFQLPDAIKVFPTSPRKKRIVTAWQAWQHILRMHQMELSQRALGAIVTSTSCVMPCHQEKCELVWVYNAQ